MGVVLHPPPPTVLDPHIRVGTYRCEFYLLSQSTLREDRCCPEVTLLPHQHLEMNLKEIQFNSKRVAYANVTHHRVNVLSQTPNFLARENDPVSITRCSILRLEIRCKGCVVIIENRFCRIV